MTPTKGADQTIGETTTNHRIKRRVVGNMEAFLLGDVGYETTRGEPRFHSLNQDANLIRLHGHRQGCSARDAFAGEFVRPRTR